MYTKSNKHTKLEVSSEGCSKAYECSPAWKLQKSILKGGELYGKVHSCIFEGDSAKVSFELDVDKDSSGQIIFSWPILLYNPSCNLITGLKIGLKAYLVCDGKDPKFVGKFQGFEALNSNLKAGESYQYVLAGNIDAGESIRGKKLYLTTKGQISYGGEECVEYTDTTIEIDSGSNMRVNPILVCDKALDFKEEVCEEKTITICTTLTPGDNIECGGTFCNSAVLHELPKKHCGEDSCSHDSCKSGPKIKDSESSASIKLGCAKICFDCKLDSKDCQEDWCLCQTSTEANDVICYKISASKCNEKLGEACLSAHIKVDGCCPDYDKEFKLELLRDDKVIDSVTFELGKSHKDFHYPEKDQTHTVSLDKHGSGEFSFLLSYNKQIYDVNKLKAHLLECDPTELCCKKSCNSKQSKACLTTNLCIPHGARYSIKDKGSFETKDDLKRFLSGDTIKLTDNTDFDYKLSFDKCSGKVISTVKLVYGHSHGGSTISVIEDTLGDTSEERSRRKRHESDQNSKDCDVDSDRHVTKPSKKNRHRDDCCDPDDDQDDDKCIKTKKNHHNNDDCYYDDDCKKKNDCDEEDKCNKRCKPRKDCDLTPTEDPCCNGGGGGGGGGDGGVDLPDEGGDHSPSYPTEDLQPVIRCDKNYRSDARSKKANAVISQSSNTISNIKKDAYIIERKIVVPKIKY